MEIHSKYFISDRAIGMHKMGLLPPVEITYFYKFLKALPNLFTKIFKQQNSQPLLMSEKLTEYMKNR